MKRLITIILALIMTLITAPQKVADQPPVSAAKTADRSAKKNHMPNFLLKNVIASDFPELFQTVPCSDG
jgi:hypothetical protein